VSFYLDKAQEIAAEVGYVALGDDTLAKVRQRLAAKTTGSLFNGASRKAGASLNSLLQ
jgi:hypothetical protein